MPEGAAAGCSAPGTLCHSQGLPLLEQARTQHHPLLRLPAHRPTCVPSPPPLLRCRALPERKTEAKQQLTATERAVAALAAGGSLKETDQPKKRFGFFRCCGGAAGKQQQPESWREMKDSSEESASPPQASPRNGSK